MLTADLGYTAGCTSLGELHERSRLNQEPMALSKLLRTERFEFIPARLAELTKKVALSRIEQLSNFHIGDHHGRFKKRVDNSSEHFFSRGKHRWRRHHAHAAYLLI